MSRRRAAIALLASIAGIVSTISLGNWQLRRAQEKSVLQAQWNAVEQSAPAALTEASLAELAVRLPQRVVLRGRFLHDRTVWLDNRQLEGRPGFWVVTPLQLDGASTLVLVNRGWAPRNAQQRESLPPIDRPAGMVEIDGLALSRLPRLLEIGAAATPGPLPAIWQNLDFDAYERASAVRVARLVVLQLNAADDGLVRRWPRPDTGVDKHRGYALQWYSLATLIATLTIWFGGRELGRWRRSSRARR